MTRPDPLARAARRGCAAQLVILVVAPLVVLALLVLAGVVAGLVGTSPQSRLLVGAVSFAALGVAFAVGALAFAARRAQVLDPAFAQLGVAPATSLVNLRTYRGAWQGRELGALYSRRGPLLEVHVSTRVFGAFAVGTRTAAGEMLRELAGARECQLGDPAFAPYIVSAHEPEWAMRVLATPGVRARVLALLADPSGSELRVVALRPGAVRLTRRYFDPDRAVGELPPMVDALAGLAAEVDALPPPRVQVPLSDFERAARERPVAVGMKVVAALVAFVLLLVVVATAAILAFSTGPTREGAAPEPGDPTPRYERRRRH